MSLNLPPRITGLLKTQDLAIKDIADLCSIPARNIKGIGSVYRKKLLKRDITTIADLADLKTFPVEGISSKLLEKWVIAAKIIMRFADEGEVTAVPRRKLVVAGLDHAGKTSVLESLRAMKSVAAKRATSGARATSILFAGFNILSFDLGGQIAFRESYLAEADTFFSGVGSLIFVIDIQESNRQKETFDYFSRILKLQRFLKEEPPISILFHKYDPSGIDNDAADKVCMQLEEQYQDFASSLLYKILNFYKTSIYDIPGLSYAFSEIFSQISPVSRILNDTLGWFCEEKGLQGCHLFSDNWFVVAQWIDKITEAERDDVFLKSLQAVRSMVNRTQSGSGEVVEMPPYYFYAREIPVGETKVFLSLFDAKHDNINESDLDLLDKTLSPWIRNFFALM
ncbi:MAG: ADP-ribosylation factor-like protein [Candidatus Hodarchaeales archaeon]